MNEANIIMRTLTSSVKANGAIEDQMSHAISLVWKYIVLVVDLSLQRQENKYLDIKNNFDERVQQVIKQVMDKF